MTKGIKNKIKIYGISKKKFSYYSPLFVAVMNKHIKCVRLLCSHDKIEINVKNKDGIFYI